jgi:hypothetical protein
MDRRQQKLQKKKKKREIVVKRKRALAASRPSLEERAVALAAKGPFGRCFISDGWDSDEKVPPLVTVVVTRLLPDGESVPAVALVDRTCLGVKSAFVVPPTSDAELTEMVQDIGEVHGGMNECSPLVAQSIVFHALDYAARLGFEPDPDFSEELFGPRPAELIETPWHRLERPLYLVGPEDDAASVMRQLSEKVGIGNWDLAAGGRVIAGTV